MEFIHMSKKLNGFKWLCIVTLVPNEEEDPTQVYVGMKTE
jgi:hypothetical protein